MEGQGADRLIENLTAELLPVRPLRHPLVRSLPFVVLALLYTSGVVWHLGLRPDLVHKFKDTVFLFETGLAGFIALSAALASVWTCVPDMRGQKWVLALPLVSVGVFLFWTGLRAWTEGASIPTPHWDHCFEDALLLGALPAAFVIVLSRKGATTCPRTTAGMNILSTAALGYVGLRFTCMLDTVGHTALYHLLPFLVLGGILGLTARRLYRW